MCEWWLCHGALEGGHGDHQVIYGSVVVVIVIIVNLRKSCVSRWERKTESVFVSKKSKESFSVELLADWWRNTNSPANLEEWYLGFSRRF